MQQYSNLRIRDFGLDRPGSRCTIAPIEALNLNNESLGAFCKALMMWWYKILVWRNIEVVTDDNL